MTIPGFIDVIEGAGLGWMILRPIAFEVPPPGAGLMTVIFAVPGFAMSTAGIFAVN
jgi:hypothetical protein